jgi:hypothetical protein
MISTMPTVACSECRRENEIERIYCHDCGARLERKAIQKIVPKKEDAHSRVKKLFDSRRAKVRAVFFKISKLVLAACGSAALTVMALPPELPAVPKDKDALIQAPTIGYDLERVLARHEPTQVKYTTDQTNLFLVSHLKSKKKALDQPFLEFKSAVASFHEGTASVTMERAIFGYSIFTTIDFAPQSSGGKASVKPAGGRIGRMPIHPEIAKYMNYLFLDLWGSLEREQKLASRLTSIEFHDKSVLLLSIP